MAHAGHTLTGPKPNNWISIFLLGLRSIVGLRLFVCHVAASPMAKASYWSSINRWPSFVRLSRGCFPNNEGIGPQAFRPSVSGLPIDCILPGCSRWVKGPLTRSAPTTRTGLHASWVRPPLLTFLQGRQ